MSGIMHLLSGGRSSAGSGRGGGSAAAAGPPSDDVATLTQGAVPITSANLPQALNAILDSIPETTEIVCIGESTHGTRDFYEMRAELTKLLIARRGFSAVVLESDYPDTSLADAFVKGIKLPDEAEGDPLFLYQRFPQWMWRNETFRGFCGWLKDYNAKLASSSSSSSSSSAPASDAVGIYGMDLYSLFASIDEVVEYLSTVDPSLATEVQERWLACFEPFREEEDPQAYGQSVSMGWTKQCADGALETLTTLYNRRNELIAKGTLVLEEARRKAARLQKGRAEPSQPPSASSSSAAGPYLYPPSDPTIVTGPHGPRLHHEIVGGSQPQQASAGAGGPGGVGGGPSAAAGAGNVEIEHAFSDPAHRQFNAEMNALAVKDSEAYYRGMFSTRVSTWNLRDTHMVTAISKLQDFLTTGTSLTPPPAPASSASSSSSSSSSPWTGATGQPLQPSALQPSGAKKKRLVIWAHNSHLGDASATDSWTRNKEVDVGMLLRQQYGRDKVFLLGQYTATGTVTAASNWDGPSERKNVRPPLAGSYEDLLQRVQLPAYYLNLRTPGPVRELLTPPRLQRAIGVIYKPKSERWSHYFESSLSHQYDGVVFFRETSALVPLEATSRWKGGEEEAYPTGL